MNCPACKQEFPDDRYRCPACNYGVKVDNRPIRSIPRYLGDTSQNRVDHSLAIHFRCGNCRSYGAKVRRIATTGAGFSRIMDWQCNEFIVVSCLYCGIIQQFDPTIIDKESMGWKSLDFLFDI